MVKSELQTRGVARSHECVALGAKRACRQVSELRLLATCRALLLYQRQDVQATLMGPQGLDLVSAVFFHPLFLPYKMCH